jgi:hypothetical protein
VFDLFCDLSAPSLIFATINSSRASRIIQYRDLGRGVIHPLRNNKKPKLHKTKAGIARIPIFIY